jgi:hypothetical protein
MSRLLRNRVRRVAVKGLGAFHQRLGQRRMRMHRQRDVLGGRAHFHGQRRLGNQFARARAHDAHAQHAVASGSINIFVRPSVRSKTARGRRPTTGIWKLRI